MDMNKKHSLTSVDFVTYRDFFVPVVSIFVFNASEHILLDGFVTKEVNEYWSSYNSKWSFI